MQGRVREGGDHLAAIITECKGDTKNGIIICAYYPNTSHDNTLNIYTMKCHIPARSRRFPMISTLTGSVNRCFSHFCNG
jgi:hypothetical protein